MHKSILLKLMLIGCLILTGCGLNQDSYTLTVKISGEGKVLPAGGNLYSQGTIVTVKAIPEEGWEFGHWKGPVAEPYANETTLIMDENKGIKAVFTNQPDPLIQVGPGGIIYRRANGAAVKYRPEGNKDIEYIMLHAISDAASNPQNPYQIERIRAIFDEYGVESHFAIDRDGSIYRFVEDNQIAHHAGQGSWENNPRLTNNMNRYSLGIELLGLGTKGEMAHVIGEEANAKIRKEERGYTRAQYENLNHLLRYLTRQYNIPKQNIITHADYDPGRKWDPGELFDWHQL